MGCDTLIVDTAGRLHVDQELMAEMESLKKLLAPQEILFVADAMTGQDAVNSAQDFHSRLGLTGVVLTKMDGDARGGAALSIRHVTGQPIKFIGVGEKPDAFEPFHPDRIVGRILGMGDMLSLIEKAESTLDRKKSEDLAKKALLGDGFSLEDFRDQLRQIKKLGSMEIDFEDAALGGALCRHEAGSGAGGREAIRAPRGHHQLHDAEGAPQSRDHLRHAAQAHRRRLGHERAGCEPAPAPVRADGQDVQEHGQNGHGEEHDARRAGGDGREAAVRAISNMTALQDQLDEITANTRKLVQPERMAISERAVEELFASGIEDRILPVGAAAPEFSINDSAGRAVRSGDLLALGPLVLDFFRGRWCPYCVTELEAWRDLYPRLREAGVLAGRH